MNTQTKANMFIQQTNRDNSLNVFMSSCLEPIKMMMRMRWSLLPFSTRRANTSYYHFYWWDTNEARQSKKIKMTPDQQADLQFVRKLHINAQTLSSCYTKRQYTNSRSHRPCTGDEEETETRLLNCVCVLQSYSFLWFKSRADLFILNTWWG